MILTMGDLTLDILVKGRGPISPGSDVEGQISFRGGGSAANFASWVAYQGIGVTFIGVVGDDIGGEILSQDVKERGISLHIKKVKDQPTGSILLFIDEGGDRHMVSHRGANLELTPEDLQEEPFREAEHLHLTAYSLFGGEMMLKTTIKAMELAKKYSLSLSIDPSSYALLKDFGVNRFLNLTREGQFIFPNLMEGELLTACQEKEGILRALSDHYLIPILKLGEDGAMYRKGSKVQYLKVIEPAVLVDTIGAGDAFAAGFMVSYLQDNNLDKAVHQAMKLAKESIGIKGGRPPISKIP